MILKAPSNLVLQLMKMIWKIYLWKDFFFWALERNCSSVSGLKHKCNSPSSTDKSRAAGLKKKKALFHGKHQGRGGSSAGEICLYSVAPEFLQLANFKHADACIVPSVRELECFNPLSRQRSRVRVSWHHLCMATALDFFIFLPTFGTNFRFQTLHPTRL